jgi:two-component system phosphate regulon sensor histidine kinase PhoR
LRLKRFISTDSIPIDGKLFEQVLNNLIENACKYGSIEPTIEVHCSKIENGYLLTIADDGPGIAKEHLTRIFERFYRVDSARDRESGGTGLGLSIVKHIIMKHHGTIHADSDGVRGTKFNIFLPETKLE